MTPFISRFPRKFYPSRRSAIHSAELQRMYLGGLAVVADVILTYTPRIYVLHVLHNVEYSST